MSDLIRNIEERLRATPTGDVALSATEVAAYLPYGRKKVITMIRCGEMGYMVENEKYPNRCTYWVDLSEVRDWLLRHKTRV